MDTASFIHHWPVGLAALAAALGAAALALRAAVGVRLAHPRVRIAKCEELPQALEALLAPAERKLRGYAFEPAFCVRERDLVCGEERWKRVYVNARERAYAAVAPSSHPAEQPGCEVAFVTVYADGTLLLTLNGRRHRMLWDLPRAVVNDPYADRIEGQYEVHRAEALDSDKISERVAASPAVYKSRLQLAYDTYIEVLLEARWIRKRGEDEYAVRVRRALGLKRQIRRGERQRSARRANQDLALERRLPPAQQASLKKIQRVA